MAVTLNASTSSGFVQTADTSGTVEIQSNGSTKLTIASTGVSGTVVSGTAVASTSGTSIDFTSIPSWVKRVTISFGGVSTNGTSNCLIQIGSGSVTTSGYVSTAATSGGNTATSTAGFVVTAITDAAGTHFGQVVVTLLNTNVYACSSMLGQSGTVRNNMSGGWVTLGGTLDRVRITTVNGTDTFDAGTINILYEG